MTPEEYRLAALRTEHTPNFITHARRTLPPHDANTEQVERARRHDQRLSRMIHAVLGMITELGELCDPLKKHLIYGATLDTKNLAEERGDDCWYDNLFDDALEEKLTDIWTRNIAKLRARFPDKFTEEKALNRDLAAEQKALEAPSPFVHLNPSIDELHDERDADHALVVLRRVAHAHGIDSPRKLRDASNKHIGELIRKRLADQANEHQALRVKYSEIVDKLKNLTTEAQR